ncbi:MAG: hypothetical protein QOJ65_876 [Fimbriimonadaceae bacterium]|jgi:hypothetical protein|nr:hypothetical protein [Fimbriimonadaceae bacterium]
MRTLRTALTAAALSLLCIGYAASQWAWLQGTFPEYYARVDSPPVRILSGVLLLCAVVLAFIPDRSEEEQPR